MLCPRDAFYAPLSRPFLRRTPKEGLEPPPPPNVEGMAGASPAAGLNIQGGYHDSLCLMLSLAKSDGSCNGMFQSYIIR
jgi:hypothetical protein